MLNAVKEIQLLLTVAVCVEYILWSNSVPIQLYNAEPIENKNNSANAFQIFLFYSLIPMAEAIKIVHSLLEFGLSQLCVITNNFFFNTQFL